MSIENLTQEEKNELGIKKYDPTNPNSSANEQPKDNSNTNLYADTDSVKTPELAAALELVKESNATIAALNKEIADLKQANAKLAIQQSFSAPQRSAEDIINEMF